MRKSYGVFLGGAAAVALAVSGCGDDKSVTTTVTTAPATTPAATEAVTTAAATTSPAANANPLDGINTPSGAKQLSSGSKDGAYYARYSTSQSPKAVEAAYRQEFSDNGWQIVNSGGSGGGWGPYGGSDYGLTAKKNDDYADVQAGGDKGSTTYFEVCAGAGTRELCDHLSNEANTNSGGSHGGSDSSHTRTGAS